MQNTGPTGWAPASEEWMRFAKKHPELGIKGNNYSWIHFQRTHAEKLMEVDVIRRIAFRGRMIADTNRFEQATFNLLTTGAVEGRHG